jgi:purine-nucleoside/S-methyl-5'-thioadenosine phosphorylase / adenosine deaminase
VICWSVPGPYVVAFTTRAGGVSRGPFASLNLGSRDDDPVRVAKNRRILCDELGLDPERLAVNRQRHSAIVNRARPGGPAETGDALWTDEPGVPLLALAADCVPIAIAAVEGPPALAVVHAGWRGLVAGIVEAAAAAVGSRARQAIVGPAAGPCCYEVGREVSRRFDVDLTRGRLLDLWEASERALRNAGVGTIERIDLCTRCNPDLFFSFRRTGAPHGAHGVVGALVG